jgi:signal transduction histidine kinase
MFDVTITDLTSIVAFAISSGLILAVLLQLKQDRANRLLFVFCACLMFWCLIILLALLTEPQFQPSLEAPSPNWWKWDSSAYMLTSISYAVFIIQFLRAKDSIVRWLIRLSPLALIIGLLLIWSDVAISEDLRFQPTGYVVVGLAVVYAAGGLWAILSSMHELAAQLRLAGLLMMIGFASDFLGIARSFPISLLGVCLGALLLGWITLRFQLKKPIRELAEEIRVANRDLRQVVTDLATERSAKAELTKQLEDSRRYSQYKNTFLDKLGHKLRTPLNSIVGYSALLESGTYGELNEKQQDRLSKINRNGNILLSLINDMLDLNRIDAGQLEIYPRPLHIPALIDGVVTELEHARIAKGLSLKVEVDSDLKMVHVDEARISQVLTQLVGNAVKYTHQGGVTIIAQNVLVKSGLADRLSLPLIGWLTDGEWVVTHVEDTGIGIPPEAQGQVFEEFYQAEDSESPEIESTGLGLAIVKKLVDLHGGVIWVKSQPEQGSTFYLALRAYNS